MEKNNVIEIVETTLEKRRNKFVVYGALAIASVVGAMGFALAIKDNGETETIDSSTD